MVDEDGGQQRADGGTQRPEKQQARRHHGVFAILGMVVAVG